MRGRVVPASASISDILPHMRALLSLVGTLTLPFVSACTGAFYFPDSNVYFPPEQGGYKAEDVFFQASDGTRLHGWFFPALQEAGNGTIVQFHGNAQNLTSHYASLVWATKRGYDLFIFDYRGYGKSLGSPNPEGTHRDGLAALNWAWARHSARKNRRFIVYGQSLGGVIGARAFADFPHRNETKLLVLDSTFYSYKDIAQEKLSGAWLTWPFSPLGQVLVSDSYASEKVLPAMQQRTLVIHDRLDPVVSYQNGEHVFQLLPGPKDFWTFERGLHVGAFASDTLEIRDRFLNYVEKL